MIGPRRLALGIVMGYSVALGCRERTAPADDGASTKVVLGRYWLRATPLLDAPEGRATRFVPGPRQVELLQDGHVRTPPGEREPFEGYLPKTVLERPQKDQGLMLYAQSHGELHWRTPNGPVIGHIYPGAMVTVVPTDQDRVAVGSLGFDKYGPLEAYVDRSILGSRVRALEPPLRRGRGHALVATLDFLFDDPISNGSAAVAANDCVATWLPEGANPSQYVAGVEIGGRTEFSDDGTRDPRTQESTVLCAARAVSRHGDKLFLAESVGGGEREVEQIPQELTQIELPKHDPLLEAVSHSRSVFWLVYDRNRPFCDEWTFETATRHVFPSRVKLTARLRPKHAAGTLHPLQPEWYDSVYWISDGSTPARLELEGASRQGGRAYPDFRYGVLGAQGAAVVMMPYRLPERAIAYDPDEAERWFLDRSACETALSSVIETLAPEPSAATRVGFHIRY